MCVNRVTKQNDGRRVPTLGLLEPVLLQNGKAGAEKVQGKRGRLYSVLDILQGAEN